MYNDNENSKISRKNRKKEHIEFALKAALESNGSNGFSDVHLLYEALPELNLDEIDTTLCFLGKRLNAPLLINAMTGGHPAVKHINRSLAKVAARAGIAMAVGSQIAGLEDQDVQDTYKVARDENPHGVLLANVSALTASVMVKEAIEMIDADGVQLHLNVAQELAMNEGDRNFKGTLNNIESIVSLSNVPVIVKEVGFGLSRETIKRIYDTGVRYIDVAGKGGTDFIKIENMRSGQDYLGNYQNIGISTAASLIEAHSLNLPLCILASGGFNGGSDVAGALALGAELVGLAGHFLQVLFQSTEQGLNERVDRIIDHLRRTMLMVGASNLKELAAKPVIITGSTAEWLTWRGINI
jgi:isopentenyl-diphosphate delta-isomerase